MDLGAQNSPNLEGLQWFKVRFETLNPFTPDPDFDNLFCVFLQAIGEFQFLVYMIPASYWFERARSFSPASYWGDPIWKVLLLRQATGKFICEIWLLGNSILEGFESVSLPLL